MGNPYARVTSAGAQWVEDRRKRRTDPTLRARAARSALLKWLWTQKQEGVNYPEVNEFQSSSQAEFEGGAFTDSEVDRASEYLHKAELIEGVSAAESRGPLRAETTAKGDYCVEHHGGNVSEYERSQMQGGTVFNIHSNTGNIAANSRDFTMNATTNNGIDAAGIVMLARALRQAAPVLGLPEDEAEELTTTADRIEQEAGNDSPNLSRLQRWGRSVIAILNSPIVSGALGPVLSAYAGTVIPGLPEAVGS